MAAQWPCEGFSVAQIVIVKVMWGGAKPSLMCSSSVPGKCSELLHSVFPFVPWFQPFCILFYAQASEDNLQEQGLSFHHVGPGDWSQAVSHMGSCLLDILFLVS